VHAVLRMCVCFSIFFLCLCVVVPPWGDSVRVRLINALFYVEEGRTSEGREGGREGENEEGYR